MCEMEFYFGLDKRNNEKKNENQISFQYSHPFIYKYKINEETNTWKKFAKKPFATHTPRT